jgi:flavodoxin I
MKALIVYDSVFGNTEKVARTIGSAVGAEGQVEVMKVDTVQPVQLSGVELLVVGSPTRGFQMTKPTSSFLKSIPDEALKGVRVAAFDTRIDMNDPVPGFLKVMVRIFGYAAQPIANKLVKKGGKLAAPAEGFLVAGSEGPMKDGEMERAEEWGRKLSAVSDQQSASEKAES